MIVGEEINSRFNHVFDYHPSWEGYPQAANLALSDFTPPSVNSIDAAGDTCEVIITADISDGVVAYLFYKTNSVWNVEKMSKNSNQYSISPGPPTLFLPPSSRAESRLAGRSEKSSASVKN